MALQPIVLAAGASSRLGSPKALVPLDDGRTVLAAVLQCIAEALPGGPAPVVVAGCHATEILPEAERCGAAPLEHAEWERGRMSSLQAAVEFTAGGTASANDLLVWPVDRPGCSLEDLVALSHAWRDRDSTDLGWMAPRAPSGRHGHPVLIGAGLVPGLLGLGPDASLREVRDRAAWLDAVPVPHSGIELDLDRPEDVEPVRAWFRALGRG